jgi:hypothetical protein
VFIAVVVYVASGSRLGVVRQRLLSLRADRDFVLRGCGLGCSLLSLGWCWCSCWLRLRHCVDWLNRLNGIAHARHLTQLPSTKGKLTLERGRKKMEKLESVPNRNSAGSSAAPDEPIFLFCIHGQINSDRLKSLCGNCRIFVGHGFSRAVK